MKAATPWIDSAERVAQRAAALGWTPGTGGHMSINLGGPMEPRGVPDLLELGSAVPHLAGNTLLLTRSGARFRALVGNTDFGYLRPLPRGDRAEVWFPDESMPTFELDAHLAIHAALKALDSPAKAVLHVHPPSLVALTHVKDLQDASAMAPALMGAHAEAACQVPGGIGYIPYTRSGATALARKAAEAAVRGVSIVVWGLRGCFTMAEDLETCLDLAELVESAARIRLAALATGQPLQGLPEGEIQALEQRRERPGMWEEGKAM